jgi:hypothetical protein
MKSHAATTWMIRTAIMSGLCLLPVSAHAAELSPWLGSVDQTAFQLDPHTMVAVTFAADPLHTGSLKPQSCTVEGCTPTSDAAMNSSTATTAPKN